MKSIYIIHILITTIAFLSSCDKPYNYDIYSKEYNPLNRTYFSGDTASGEYIDYTPDKEIDLSPIIKDSTKILLDSLDLDNDGTYDLGILKILKNTNDTSFNLDSMGIFFVELKEYMYFEVNKGSYEEFYNTFGSYSILTIGKEQHFTIEMQEYGNILYDVLHWQGLYYENLLLGSNFSWYPYGEIIQTSLTPNTELYFAYKYYTSNSEQYRVYLGWIKMELSYDFKNLKIKDQGFKLLIDNEPHRGSFYGYN